jgi:peptidoglycan/LPS O-acetylase OafA/YrhL
VVIGEHDFLHAFYGTDARVQTLLLGAALALAAVFGKLPAAPRRWTNAVGWVGAGTLAVAFVTYDNASSFNTRGGLTLVGIAAVALLFGVVCAPGTGLARGLSTPVPVAIGRISYGLYLWHYPVFLCLTRDDTGLTVWATGWSFWPLLALRLVVTFALATASFVLVERPFLRIKRRFERLADRPGAAVVLAPGVTVAQ